MENRRPIGASGLQAGGRLRPGTHLHVAPNYLKGAEQTAQSGQSPGPLSPEADHNTAPPPTVRGAHTPVSVHKGTARIQTHRLCQRAPGRHGPCHFPLRHTHGRHSRQHFLTEAPASPDARLTGLPACPRLVGFAFGSSPGHAGRGNPVGPVAATRGHRDGGPGTLSPPRPPRSPQERSPPR